MTSENPYPDISLVNTAMLAVSPEKDLRFKNLQSEIDRIFEYAEKAMVTSVDDYKKATNDLVLIANVSKALEEMRKSYVDPFNQHLKEINGAFKLLSIPLGNAKSILNERIGAYNRHMAELKRLQEEAEQKANELLQKTGEIIDVPKIDAAPIQRMTTDIGTVGARKDWKYKITDFSKLPDEYKVENKSMIMAKIRQGHAIPGVESWQEESYATYAKKDTGGENISTSNEADDSQLPF